MHLYEIAYDLNRPGQNYPELFRAIESYPSHWHFMKSGWLVWTDRSAVEICRDLLKHIDGNDKLFVSQVNNDASWFGFPTEGTNWIKQKFAA